jgi:WD40 repeat protein
MESETMPLGLNYSLDNRYLISGSLSKFNYELINIYDSKKDYKKIQTFKKHNNLVIAVNFLDNKRAISAGGDNFEIYIWRIKDGRVLKKIEGVGSSVWSVGVNRDKIAWGNTSNYKSHNYKGDL